MDDGSLKYAGYGAAVEFNADSNFTNKMTKQGIQMKMSEVYQAIYTKFSDVQWVSVAAYMDVTDQYGNTSSAMVYKTILKSGVASKINWGADQSELELDIVPGLWTTTIISPFLNQ